MSCLRVRCNTIIVESSSFVDVIVPMGAVVPPSHRASGCGVILLLSSLFFVDVIVPMGAVFIFVVPPGAVVS